jgi:hypothetical protein
MSDQQTFDSSASETQSPRISGPLSDFVEHQRKALEEAGKAVESLLPPGFKEHSTEAGREVVKGWKVLMDAVIDEVERMRSQVERKVEDVEQSSTGKTKVKVEVTE